MSDERIQRLLRREAARQWRSTPDLWPSIQASIEQRSSGATGLAGQESDGRGSGSGQSAAAGRREQTRSWPRELGKMAAGAAFVALFAAALAAVFSGQQSILPGGESPEDEAPGVEIVTSGETLITRWNDQRSGYELVAVDAGTGKEVDRLPPVYLGSSGMNTPVGVSPDGSRLAAIGADSGIEGPYAGGVQIWPRANRLKLVDTENGETEDYPLPDDGWVPSSPAPTFSPDGEALALIYERGDGATIMLFDAETAELLGERTFDERLGYLSFHDDGEQLIVYGQEVGVDPGVTRPGPPMVTALDAKTLEPSWSVTIEDIASGWWCESNCDARLEERETAGWNPGVTMGPWGEYLYVAHVDHPAIERIDLRDQSIETIEYDIAPDKPDEVDYQMPDSGGFSMVRIGPDRDRSYLLFGGADAHTVGFVELDLSEDRASVRTSGNAPETGVPAHWIELSPDGSNVLFGGHRFVSSFETESGFQGDPLLEWSVRTGMTLEGEPILLAMQQQGSETRLSAVNPDSMELVNEWTAGEQTQWAGMPAWSQAKPGLE